MTLTRIGKAHYEERGRRIERARDWIGYTQEELADLMAELLDKSVSRQIVHILEKGARDWKGDESAVLSYLLQQSVAWLDGEPGAAFNSEAKGVYLRSHPALLAA